MNRKGINYMWKRHFHPDYDGEDEDYQPVTSHYGRHRFTTYWEKEVGLNRELIKYMRGEKFDKDRRTETMDDYVHTYYEDVEPVYRDQMFRLLSVE